MDTEQLQPNVTLRVGSKLLKDAYSGGDVLLLREGQHIQTIAELHRLVQADVRFGEDRSASIPIDLENERVLDAAASASPDDSDVDSIHGKKLSRALALKSAAIEDVRSIFECFQTTGIINLERAQCTASTLVSELVDDPSALISLVKLKEADVYTYIHSVHVAILAIFIAVNTDHEDDLESIGMGALLHDIGKSSIPVSVLRKNGPLDNMEQKIVRRHPNIGAALLVEAGFNDAKGITCVQDHHEKLTGNGYPGRKKANEISACARITAIADIYDALTSDRPYRKAMNPKDALLVMTQQMGQELDTKLLQKFISCIGYFPVGSLVQLTDGSRATVIKNNPGDPLRPVVKLENWYVRGGVLPNSVDLSAERSLFIKNFIAERTGLQAIQAAA